MAIQNMQLFIGLMSGNSLDGIDAVVADFSYNPPKKIDQAHIDIPIELKDKLTLLINQTDNHLLHLLNYCDYEIAMLSCKLVHILLRQNNLQPQQITAIASHGVTVSHQPYNNPPFSMQISNGALIAAETLITTITNFRQADIAVEGQGAPLACGFHAAIFKNTKINRAILNIGGIANITLLFKDDRDVLGYDTGPGNFLMDTWMNKNFHLKYDNQGKIAQSGTINQALLGKLLQHPYLFKSYPKSTGKDDFNYSWLHSILTSCEDIKSQDVQATLTEYTAITITNSLNQHSDIEEVILCGGGAFNLYLTSRIKKLLPKAAVVTSQKYGFDPQCVEAMAFAWLARQCINKKHGNIPSVTGAKKPKILGAIYYS